MEFLGLNFYPPCLESGMCIDGVARSLSDEAYPNLVSEGLGRMQCDNDSSLDLQNIHICRYNAWSRLRYSQCVPQHVAYSHGSLWNRKLPGRSFPRRAIYVSLSSHRGTSVLLFRGKSSQIYKAPLEE